MRVGSFIPVEEALKIDHVADLKILDRFVDIGVRAAEIGLNCKVVSSTVYGDIEVEVAAFLAGAVPVIQECVAVLSDRLNLHSLENDKFVLLAKRQLAELQEEIKRHEQAEKEVLNDRLRYIESIEGKDPDRARLMRRAAFLLYGSKKWAQELLKEAPDGSTPNSPDESSSEANMERSNGETAEPAPESSYENVEKQKAVLAKYNPKAKLRQGENGCPSEMATRFALSNIPWSEYSQAKWDMRRMLGDLGHDVESSVFTICDFNHTGREINLKGLLRANEEKEVIAVKRAYYAVQNVVSVFDDTLTRVADSGFSTKDSTVCTYEYAKADGARVFAFWTCAETTRKADKEKEPLLPAGKQFVPVYERPGDSFATRPHTFKWTGAPLKDPVWVDLFTGAVYEFPKKDVCVSANSTRYVNVPIYDSPCLLAERSALKLQ